MSCIYTLIHSNLNINFNLLFTDEAIIEPWMDSLSTYPVQKLYQSAEEPHNIFTYMGRIRVPKDLSILDHIRPQIQYMQVYWKEMDLHILYHSRKFIIILVRNDSMEIHRDIGKIIVNIV